MCTLAQCWQLLTYSRISEAILGQTKWAEISLCIALAPACAILCICWNTENRFCTGTRGRTGLEDTSQYNSSPSTWKGGTCKEMTNVSSNNSGQAICACASRLKSKPAPGRPGTPEGGEDSVGLMMWCRRWHVSD